MRLHRALTYPTLFVCLLCGAAAAQPQPAEANIPLPPGDVYPGPVTLQISPDGQMAAVMSHRPTASKVARRVVTLVNLASGTYAELGEMLPEAVDASCNAFAFSPDSAKLLAVLSPNRPAGADANLPMPDDVAYWIDLKRYTGHKIGPARGRAIWVGSDRMAMTLTRADGLIVPTEIYRLTDEKKNSMKTPVMVLKANKEGTRLLAVTVPDSQAGLTEKAIRDVGRLTVVDADGNTVREIGPLSSVANVPLVSPSFKRVAFRPPAPTTAPVLTTLQLVDLETGARDKLPDVPSQSFPHALLDDGTLVTTDGPWAEGGTRVMLHGPGGKHTDLGVKAHAVAVRGGTLYYVAGDSKKPVLKSIAMPTE